MPARTATLNAARNRRSSPQPDRDHSRARSVEFGASTPWKRISCNRGRGTSAASRLHQFQPFHLPGCSRSTERAKISKLIESLTLLSGRDDGALVREKAQHWNMHGRMHQIVREAVNVAISDVLHVN